MRRAGAILFVALAVAACSGRDAQVARQQRQPRANAAPQTTGVASTTSASSPTTVTSAVAAAPSRATAPPAAGVAGAVAERVRATKLVQLTRPVALAVRSSEPNAVYIAQKGGNVRRIRLQGSSATLDRREVLEIANKISTGPEQGLLGIAFSSDGNWLYASYTDRNNAIQISAFPFTDRAAVAGERPILTIPHPQYDDHNGGNIAFGPDGYLYIGTGDGGGAGDPFGNAQNLGSLLGKMLRIAPRTSGSPAYTIPPDNPLAATAGARAEIWHYGLRNPWRWSFDRVTGELWIADVGQVAYEEVNRAAAGAKGLNFGWNKREGRHAYAGGAMPAGAVDPEIETSHADGNCSVTGGYVYRGQAIPALSGTYVFSDFCRGELVAYSIGVARDLGARVEAPASFGEDMHGEIWVLSLTGGVYRLERA